MPRYFVQTNKLTFFSSEFTNLSDVHQEMLWSKNYKTAMAISVAQVNVIRTGKDQLKNVLGYLNSRNTDWEIPFRSVIQLDNLNCSYLHHAQVFCVSICIKSLYKACTLVQKSISLCMQKFHIGPD